MPPLMPKATAVWLIENTSLTFAQIAEFCQLHPLEVKLFADGEGTIGTTGLNPVTTGQLTMEEIHRCEADSSLSLTLRSPITVETFIGKKRTKYTPLAKRRDRPDGVAWLLKYYSGLSDTQICRLLGTTSQMIHSVRDKSHWNAANIKPKNPVSLGLCSQIELDEVLKTLSLKEQQGATFDEEES